MGRPGLVGIVHGIGFARIILRQMRFQRDGFQRCDFVATHGGMNAGALYPFTFLFVFLPPFPLNDQVVVISFHLHIILVQARQIRSYHHSIAESGCAPRSRGQ